MAAYCAVGTPVPFAPNVGHHTVPVELLVPTTRFVGCGPVTVSHEDVFRHTSPFRKPRFGWGIDVVCAELAARESGHIGAVDPTPIEHLRLVAQGYDANAATSGARQLLERFGGSRSGHQILETTAVITRL
jgi:hypothetical protein